MSQCFVVFAEELGGDGAEKHGNVFGCSVVRPRTEVASAEGAGKNLDGGLGEGGREGAMEEGVDFVTRNVIGKAGGAKLVVVRDDFMCDRCKVEVRWDVPCGLGSEAEEGYR